MANPFDRSLRLRKEIEQARLDFIWTDLGVILTLATIVEMESREGNRKHAERTLAKAEKGYSDMLRFFSQAKGLAAETEREFQSRFRQVRERLDGLPRPGLAFQSGVIEGRNQRTNP